MNDSRRKNDIFYLVLLILTMITMVVGLTFTYFSLMEKEPDDSTRVKTGILSVNYIDGDEINTYALLPISEPNLNTKYSTYKKKFSVSSDGTLDQYIDIYMNITKNDFDDNALGYILYDGNGNRIKKGTIPSTGRVNLTSNEYLKSGETKSYTVLIWLQENYKDQDYEHGATFTGSFDINAVQVKYE